MNAIVDITKADYKSIKNCNIKNSTYISNLKLIAESGDAYMQNEKNKKSDLIEDIKAKIA